MIGVDVSRQKRWDHPLIAFWGDFFFLEAAVSFLFALFVIVNFFLTSIFHGLPSLALENVGASPYVEIVSLFVCIVYHFFLVTRVGFMSPGEQLAGKARVGGKKLWYERTTDNVWLFFSATVLFLFLSGTVLNLLRDSTRPDLSSFFLCLSSIALTFVLYFKVRGKTLWIFLIASSSLLQGAALSAIILTNDEALFSFARPVLLLALAALVALMPVVVYRELKKIKGDLVVMPKTTHASSYPLVRYGANIVFVLVLVTGTVIAVTQFSMNNRYRLMERMQVEGQRTGNQTVQQ
jgi:hypothetical protein